ncbi:MAG TPA: tetratricopeptide repeat protein, partial [Longimicrobiaceae bacterium]|nr:tetratricopeptide repeat protein [Longimicrobiaceae bacterium]
LDEPSVAELSAPQASPPRRPSHAPGTHHSVVALPFANMSGDEENEYLADGLTEELINALTKIDGLRVAARTSSFAFKGRSAGIEEIAERLGVDIVIEGSLRRIGDRLRIAVQLISVEDGYHLWSDTFNRQLEDVFLLQEEIARAVATALEVTLAGEAQAPLVKASTGDVEAYTLYLKGRHFWNRRTGEGLRTAVEYFTRAIEVDPGYALAHAGLADAYAILLDYGILPPEQALPELKAAARRALELDAALAEAHTSLALAHQFEWEWAAAEREFRRALTLNPSYAVAHHRFALFLTSMDRPEESLAEIRRALELEPLSLIILTTVGWVHYYARHYEKAVEQCLHTLEMDPNFMNAHIALGLACGQLGRYEEAIAAHQQALRIAGEVASTQALMGYMYGASGERGQAQEMFERLRERASRQYTSPYYLAISALGSGDAEEAFSWLERAYREHAAHLVYLRVDPLFDSLRTDSRLDHLLARLGMAPVQPAGVPSVRG